MVAKFIAWPVVSAAAPKIAKASSYSVWSDGTIQLASSLNRSWKMVSRAFVVLPDDISTLTVAIALRQCFTRVSQCMYCNYCETFSYRLKLECALECSAHR